MQGISYYDILGVDPSVDADGIKVAFRNVARHCHPDRNPGDPEAELRFKAAAEAYRVLSHPERRRQYDLLGLRPAGSRFGDGAVPAEWHVGHFVKKVADAATRGLKAKRGQDLRRVVQLTFAEARWGHEVVLTLPRRPHGSHAASAPLQDRQLAFAIPGGVADAELLRWRGMGEPGRHGGPAGDLLVTVRVASHPLLRVEGEDVVGDLPLTLGERLTGIETDVPTLRGSARVTLRGGVRPGEVVVLEGEGGYDRRGRRSRLVYRVVASEPVALPAALVAELSAWEARVAAAGGFPDKAQWERRVAGGPSDER